MEKKIALITGATDGIGKATARKLLLEDWEVVIIGRNSTKVTDTVNELRSGTQNNSISGITADLSIMPEVKSACEQFLNYYTRLDLLLLNANAISNERIITTEGNEKNFAIGYLSRVLMIKKLEKILESTPGSQILSVIGLDVKRPDFNDLTLKNHFTGRKGLTQWQWAINLFAKEYSISGKVPINLYMPGLVKTKILANEPQPMRALVRIMNLLIGLKPEKSADNIFKVINIIDNDKLNNATFSYSKLRKPIKLEIEPEDGERLLKITDEILNKYM